MDKQRNTPNNPPLTPNTTTTNGSGGGGGLPNLYSVRAMYLGSEPMGELLEGENGSDVIQVPLKRTILRTNGLGKEVELTITHDSLLATASSQQQQQQQQAPPQSPLAMRLLKLPIELLAYCGALRQLPADKIRTREFETLDKSPLVNALNDEINPPLFVTIFRSLESENTLYCYSFVLRRDEEAMELVKVVMEIYYNLIRLNEMEMGDEMMGMTTMSNGNFGEDGGDDEQQQQIHDEDDLDYDNYEYAGFNGVSGNNNKNGTNKGMDENKFDGGGGRNSGGNKNGGGGDMSKSSLNETMNGSYSKTSSSDYLNELLNLYKKTPMTANDGNNGDVDMKNNSNRGNT